MKKIFVALIFSLFITVSSFAQEAPEVTDDEIIAEKFNNLIKLADCQVTTEFHVLLLRTTAAFLETDIKEPHAKTGMLFDLANERYMDIDFYQIAVATESKHLIELGVSPDKIKNTYIESYLKFKTSLAKAFIPNNLDTAEKARKLTATIGRNLRRCNSWFVETYKVKVPDEELQ